MRYTGKLYSSPLEAKVANNGISITPAGALDGCGGRHVELGREALQHPLHGRVRFGRVQRRVILPRRSRSGRSEEREIGGRREDGEVGAGQREVARTWTSRTTSRLPTARAEGDSDYTVNFIPGGEKSIGHAAARTEEADAPKAEPKKDAPKTDAKADASKRGCREIGYG